MEPADTAAISTATAGPGARFRRNLAVVIGVDRYGAGIPPLRSAVRDARAIASTLEHDHGFETITLVDEAAGQHDLLDLLERRLPAELGPADRLVFYFAGHGIALDSDLGPAGYLIPAGASRSEPQGFVEMRRLHRALTALPIRHVLVVLDCCFAGAFRWSSLRDVQPIVSSIFRERYDRYVSSPAWQVLTSASGDQLALDRLSPSRGEVDDGHSPFARALLAGLAGAADYTSDNLITADELAIYLREQVAAAAESIGVRQMPQLFLLERHDDGQFVFQVPRRELALSHAPPLDEDATPYRGLQSFREQDHGMFFGRDAVVQRMLEAAQSRQLTVVVGPSGCGKSSLVQAGLIPAMRKAGWTVLPPQRPGREPLTVLGALALEVAKSANVTDSPTAGSPAIAATPRLVVIDQFEELVTLCASDTDRAAFLAAISQALAADARLHVVVTVRADVEPLFQESSLSPWWTAAARFLVPGMTRNELRDIIQLPARAAVLHFEPSNLVERLIDDVALVPAPLPLLSFALSELYRRCWARWQSGARDRALLEADYVEMGSVARALTQRASALHDRLVAEDAGFALTIRHVFTRMVATIGGERARRRLVLDELVYDDPAENRRVATVLQRFHEARLLSLGTETGTDGVTRRYAEPTHDELVRGWTHVGRWLDDLDRPAGTRVLLGLVNVAVLSWRADHESKALLWTDPRIEVASRLAREQPLIYNDAETRFVSRSARLRRRRRFALVASLIGVSLVLATIATIAVLNGNRATREAAAAERMLALSYQDQGRRLLADSRPLQALPYLAEALRHGADATATNILLTEATRNLPTAVLSQNATVTGAKLSPDGTRLLVSTRSSVRVYDVTGPIREFTTLAHDEDEAIAAAAFSPDGRRIATRTQRRLLIWDTSTNRQLSARNTTTPHPKHVQLAWSCDGARIATQSMSGTLDETIIEVYQADGSGTPVLLNPSQTVYWLESSPDCATLMSAGSGTSVNLWNPLTDKRRALELRHSANAFAFDRRGTLVTFATSDDLQIWDVTAKSVIRTIKATPSIIAFSPDGTRLATVDFVYDESRELVTIWNVVTGETVTRMRHHSARITALAFSPDGKRIASSSEDRTVRIWTRDGMPLGLPLEHDTIVNSVRFGPDGARLVSRTARDVWIWDLATERPIALTRATEGVPVAVTSDGRRAVVRRSDDSAALASPDTQSASIVVPGISHPSFAHFSSDGTRVLFGDWSTRLWTVGAGAVVDLKLTPTHWEFIGDAGDRVLVASFSALTVWNAKSGTEIYRADKVDSWALSPGGGFVAVVRDGRAALLNTDSAQVTGLHLDPTDGDRIAVVAVDTNATRVVAIEEPTETKDFEISFWNRDPTTNAVHRFRGYWLPPVAQRQDGARGLLAKFSRRGGAIVAVSDTAYFWPATAGVTPTLLPHGGRIDAIAFAPAGDRVFTLGGGALRLWDVTTGRPLASMSLPDPATTTAAFSEDGRFIVAHHGRRVLLLDAGDGQLILDRTAPASSVNTFPIHDGTSHAAISDDATRLVLDDAVWQIATPGARQSRWDLYAMAFGVDVGGTLIGGKSSAARSMLPPRPTQADPYVRRSNLIYGALAALPQQPELARTLVHSAASLGLAPSAMGALDSFDEQLLFSFAAWLSDVIDGLQGKIVVTANDSGIAAHRLRVLAWHCAVDANRPDLGLALMDRIGKTEDWGDLGGAAELLFADGQFAAAATKARRAVERLPDDRSSLRLWLHATLIAAEWAQGRSARDEAAALVSSYESLGTVVSRDVYRNFRPHRVGLTHLPAERSARIGALLDVIEKPITSENATELKSLIAAAPN